ncbi:MAG: hypothetical protein ACYC96_01545 [Fimbriimonadaceae bacterium]
MNGRTLLVAFALLCGGFVVSGCSNGQPRFKGLDSYENATTTNAYGPVAGMDPYSYGGTAYASGGREPAASYGTGANGPDDGDPAHYAAVATENKAAWPIDWSGDGKPLDSSGIIVPEPPKPIGD